MEKTESKKPKFVCWMPSNSVGHSFLDNEHQKMLQIINDTFDMINEGDFHQKKTEILALIDEIIAYTKKHFASEEAILQHVCYPELKEHRRIHEELKSRTVQIKTDFLSTPDQDNLQEIFVFLKNWWLNHINNIDKKYTPYLK